MSFGIIIVRDYRSGMVKELTKGNIKKLLIAFSLPVVIGNIFQQLYNMVDTVVVGRFLGVSALAAVGATGSISFMVLGFAQGVTTGLSVITAQRFGAEDESGVKRSIASCLVLSLSVSAALTALAVPLCRPLLKLMKTPDSLIGDSYAYIVVIFAGMFACIYYNMISSILRALGNSKTPLYFLFISSALNVALDITFIAGIGTGVEGAAYVTIISQLFSGVLCTVYSLKKYSVMRVRKSDFRYVKGEYAAHLKIGLPMAFQFSITAIGMLVLQSALNGFGEIAIAGYTAANKVEALVNQPFIALGITLASFTGQNKGAGEYGRIRKGMRFATTVCCSLATAAALISVFLGKYIMLLFIDGYNSEALAFGQRYLTVTGVCYPVLAVLYCFRNGLQGMGESLVPMLGGVGELVARTVICLFLTPVIGFTGVCIAGPSAWLMADILLVVRYVFIVRGWKCREKALQTVDTPTANIV